MLATRQKKTGTRFNSYKLCKFNYIHGTEGQVQFSLGFEPLDLGIRNIESAVCIKQIMLG